MAKGDEKRQQQAFDQTANQYRQTQETRHSDLRNAFMGQYQSALEADENLRAQLESGFLGLDEYGKSLLGPGGSAGGGGGGGIPGGIDPSKISNFAAVPYGIYSDFGKGLDDEFWADWNKFSGGLDTAGTTLSDAEKAYRSFIETGGYSPAELDAMRASAMAPTTSIYRGAADEMQRQASLTGRAVSPAAQMRLAREQAGEIGDVSNRTEANIAQLMQQGREFGATGLTTAAGSRAQIAQIGMEARRAVEELDFQMRAAGAEGMTAIERERLALELQNAALNQAGASARAAAVGADARFLAQLRSAGLEGAANLYATTPAATALGQQGLLNEQALYTQQQLGNLGLMRPQQGQGRDWLGTAGQLAQIGAAFL